MKKLGILIDSFSGFSKKEVEKFGLEFVPQKVIIDGEVYEDGIDIIMSKSFKKIFDSVDAKTSMPAIGVVQEKMKELSQKYENVIFMTINKGLSSTFSTANATAQEFKNVSVVSTKLCGYSVIDVATKAIKLAENNKSLKEILEWIEEVSNDSITWVIPKNSDSLIKGGRLNGAKAAIFEKAKLIPKLQLTPEGFKVGGVSRNFGKTIKKIVEKISKNQKDYTDWNWEVIHSGDPKTKQIAIDAYNSIGIKKIRESWVSTSIGVHAGTGAIGINVWKKI